MLGFWVALGGAWGALSRFWVISMLSGPVYTGFPWATFTVNVTGSFMLAVILPFLQTNPTIRLAVVTGFLGAFTTFSTLAWEVFSLIRENQFRTAALYLVVTMSAGLLAVWGGYEMGKFVLLRWFTGSVK